MYLGLEGGDVELHVDASEEHLGLDVREILGETLVLLLDLKEQRSRASQIKLEINQMGWN